MRRVIRRTREFHGLMPAGARHPAYSPWQQMISRCTNPGHKRYADYGGRGIRVAERWLSFASFLADMGERPPGASIDRIDNDGHYEPGNCRWATRSEQGRNKRSNRLLTFQGRTLPVVAWSEETGIPESTIRRRIDSFGWDVERALTTRSDGRRIEIAGGKVEVRA